MNGTPMTEYADQLARPTNTSHSTSNRAHRGSSKMYSMHEALARDRMRESEQRSREARLTRSLAAQRRWHRVSLRARAVSERHAQRASQVVAVR